MTDVMPADLERVRFITGDITDGPTVLGALKESAAQRVIHLAGLQVPTCKADPVAGALVNVVGTLNMFEAARTVGVKGLVYASSAAVYERMKEMLASIFWTIDFRVWD